MICGILAAMALPPIHALPLLWISFPCLIWLLDGDESNKEAFNDGWWFGFGHFSLSFYWISHALLIDPLRFGYFVPIAVFGLSGFFGVFVGATALFARLIAQPKTSRVLTFALIWILFEWVRSWVFTGFPWNLIGSVWMPILPMIQFTAIVGTYGLGLLTVIVATIPVLLIQPSKLNQNFVVTIMVILAIIVTWGSFRLTNGSTNPVPDVRLRLVQPNIKQTLKWNNELRMIHLREHLNLTMSPGWDNVTDVIWSETAAPSFLEQDATVRQMLVEVTPHLGVLIVGAVRRTALGEVPFRIWNSLLAMTSNGKIVGTYDKAHLVPFGEYMPLSSLFVFNKITAGNIDFTPGTGSKTLILPRLPPVGPLICYEVIFSGAVVDQKNRPAWLLNLTNDGWYGISAGPYQHFAATRLRAVEEGLPLVRVANTGISAVIDPYGRVISKLSLGKRGIIDSYLPQPLSVISPFAKFGVLSSFIFWILTAFCDILLTWLFRNNS
jgi:apolipoprotein N-acyltransferase